MAATDPDLSDILALEPHGPDVYVGISIPTPWDRVYGGQVVAQGLWAASDTVGPEYRVHSVRAYFIRGGELSEPIRFEVDRIRNGRSFTTRRVVARQSSGAILNLDASFQVPEVRADVQPNKMPTDIPGPEDSEPMNWGSLHDRRLARFDREGGRVLAWQRINSRIPDGQVSAACALAYASDDVPMLATRTIHPVPPTLGAPNPDIVMSASLDHAIWFHREVPAEGWMLYDLEAQGWTGGRGLAFGHVYAPDGTHVASLAQEALVRERLSD